MKKTSTPFRYAVCYCWLFLTFLLLPTWTTGQCTEGSAATSYSNNNGQRGAMFNITAGSAPITITSLDGNLYDGTSRYEIYYKSGSYIGSETTAANWTFAGGADNVTSLGVGVATPIPIPLYITIPANTTYGFYFTNTSGGGLKYISSSVGGVTLASNSDLTVTGGVGKAYPFGATYSYRLVCCTVHYFTGNISANSALATSTASSFPFIQSTTGSTLFSNGCNSLIAKVTASGASPASGSTIAKVWIDAGQPVEYVKRHYQITPANNGSGRVTLYFTDAEFNAFNTQSPAPPLLLPVSTDDPVTMAARIANLLVEKRPGASSDGSGELPTYSGTPATIDPADGDIIWNSTDSRWEVTFDVTGFSGFWVKTSAFTLPLKLTSFTASRLNNSNFLKWTTANEINTKSFEIERSTDGNVFVVLASIAAKNNGNYAYVYQDQLSFSNKVYYRLKMVDQDNRFTYSTVVMITAATADGIQTFSVYPNPVKSTTTIMAGNGLIGSKAKLTDLQGKVLKEIKIQNNFELLDMSRLPSGIYLLHLSGGLVQKIIKE